MTFAPRMASGQLFRLPSIALVLGAGLLLRLVVAYVLFPGEGLKADIDLLGTWAQTMTDYGPGGFYAHAGFADYAPGYLWVLWIVGLVGNGISGLTGQASADVIASIIKIPAILADLAIAWMLFRAASKWYDRRTGLIAASLYLFIPVTWLDSALWGQVDAIGALLLLGAILLLIEGWSEPAVALAVFATVTKPQYGIGLVIIGAVLLRRHLLRRGSGPVPALGRRLGVLDARLGGLCTSRQGVVRLVSCAVVALVVGFGAILPFDLPTQAAAQFQGTPLLGHISGLLAMFAASAGYFQVLTANAFNMWSFVGPTPLTQAFDGTSYAWTYDSLPLLGDIQAVTIGVVLLGTTALAVVGALLIRDDRRMIIMGFTILAVAFYVLPTRVHERYMFPAFAVGALLAATSIGWRRWYVVLGLANAGNLYAILTFNHINYATPGLIGLPLADFMRSGLMISVLAIAQTILFAILLVALIREVPWPVLWARAGRTAPGNLVGAPRAVSPGPAAATTPAVTAASLAHTARLVLAPIRRRLDSAPAPEDNSAEIAVEGRGHVDRRDIAIVFGLILLTLVMRTFRLSTPLSMYFDESFYPRTGMEFLQDWRYGIPHDLWETTHPPLSKYIIAQGIDLFGDNKVTSTSDLKAEIRDVAFEPAIATGSGSNEIGGDRIAVATGDGVRIAPHGDLSAAKFVALPGASEVVFDVSTDRLFVGTRGGGLWVVDSAALALADTGRTIPAPVKVLDLGSSVRRLWPAGDGQIAAATQDGQLAIVSSTSGSVVATASEPEVSAVVPLNGANSKLAVLAIPTGLREVELSSLKVVADLPLETPPGDAVLVDGSDFLHRNREMLEVPTLYVTTDGGIQTVTVGSDGSLTRDAAFPMPGLVQQIQWDRPTNDLHVLGTAPDGKPTIYVVMPSGNVVFADAELPFQPSAWVLDVQPNLPSLDRQRAMAFSATGQMASVDVGGNSFAWRILGVIAGSLMAGLLYLLARLLFRRRTVGWILAIILALEGLLFSQARIAMNDAYLGLFIVAALTLLAYLSQQQVGSRGDRLGAIVGLPLVGVLLGLALATKWVGAYAIGGAVLIVLFRSPIGRRIALAGMVGLAGVLGFQALADDPPNLVFPAIMIALTFLLAAAIVYVERNPAATGPSDGPAWADPRRGFAVPFAWALVCLIAVPFVVYVVSYIPWALTVGGSPQLFAGWPPGHTGQTFIDLQAQMYAYHNDLRIPHGASSPWWAWPLDLKPIWGYWETFIDRTEAIVIGAGNPILLWLAIPAVAFGAWQAWRRRSQSLLFVIVAFLALWLPWSRIDRVAFNYHYYTALPFALMLLAYFLAELWDGPSRRTWTLGKLAFAVVLIAPAALWIFRAPLCTVAGVDSSSSECSGSLTDVLLPVVAWLIAALVAGWFILGARRPRHLVAAILGTAAIVFIVSYPGLAAVPVPAGVGVALQGLLPSWDTTFRFGSDTTPSPPTPLLGLGSMIVLALVGAGSWWVMRSMRSGRPFGVRRLAASSVVQAAPQTQVSMTDQTSPSVVGPLFVRTDGVAMTRTLFGRPRLPQVAMPTLNALIQRLQGRWPGPSAMEPAPPLAGATSSGARSMSGAGAWRRSVGEVFASDRRGRLIGGFAAWLLFLSAGPVPRIFDAAEYWDLSTYWVDGIAHVELFRGYASGLFFIPAVLLSRLTPLSPELAILVEMSIVFAALGWIVLPRFAAAALGRPVTLGHRVVSTILLWVLWGGFASMALMDVPAVFLFILAILVSWKKGAWWLAVLAGALVGWAYNIRPAYIAGAIGLVIAVAVFGLPDWRRRLRQSAMVTLGILLSLAPQSLVNISAGAPAFPPTPALTSEFLAFHLSSGLIYQRYETAIDPAWPSPQIWSCDPAGIALVQGSGLPAPNTLGEYAGLLVSNPEASAGLIARRVSILIWLNERSPYVSDVSNRTGIYGFMNVVLVGLLIAFALAKARLRSGFMVALVLILLACGPGLISLPDLRFFLPLSAAAIAFALPSLAWLRREGWRLRMVVIVGCVTLVLASSGVATQATALQLPGIWPQSGGPACPTVPFVR